MTLKFRKDLWTSPRMLVGYRVIIALIGGYAASVALTLLVTHFSSYQGVDLRVLIYLVFFTLYTVAIIYLFAINSHRKAFVVALSMNLVAWTALWMVGGFA